MLFRSLSDATGVQQDGTFEEWLSAVEGSRFSAPLREDTRRDGKKELVVNLWEAKPAA